MWNFIVAGICAGLAFFFYRIKPDDAGGSIAGAFEIALCSLGFFTFGITAIILLLVGIF